MELQKEENGSVQNEVDGLLYVRAINKYLRKALRKIDQIQKASEKLQENVEIPNELEGGNVCVVSNIEQPVKISDKKASEQLRKSSCSESSNIGDDVHGITEVHNNNPGCREFNELVMVNCEQVRITEGGGNSITEGGDSITEGGGNSITEEANISITEEADISITEEVDVRIIEEVDVRITEKACDRRTKEYDSNPGCSELNEMDRKNNEQDSVGVLQENDALGSNSDDDDDDQSIVKVEPINVTTSIVRCKVEEPSEIIPMRKFYKCFLSNLPLSTSVPKLQVWLQSLRVGNYEDIMLYTKHSFKTAIVSYYNKTQRNRLLKLDGNLFDSCPVTIRLFVDSFSTERDKKNAISKQRKPNQGKKK